MTDLSFLAPPGDVADWRMTLLFDAVAASGVFERLPGRVDDLAAELGLDAHALQVALDALAVWNVVEADGRGGFRPAATAPGADAATLRHHARAVRAWATSIEDRLRGVAPEGPGGIPQPEVFHDALATGARKAAPALVDLCLARFPEATCVLDLGGLHGEYSLEFARRGLRVTMQDLPPMIDLVRRRGRLEAAGVELFAGSFFETVPGGPFDLAFCCGVTHTFDGARNVALYRRLRPVVSPPGGVAVVTFLRHRHPLADVFAVQMLVNAHGGDSHGEGDYRAWLDEAGFRVDDEVIDIDDRPQSAIFAS